MFHACHRFWNPYKTYTFCWLLTRCTIPCACRAKRHLTVEKCSVPLGFLHFWLRNLLRATAACTFSKCQLPKKSAETLNCSLFWLLTWTCFAPQRRALFWHHIPKVVRRQCGLYILTWKCASRRKNVHFFSILTSKGGSRPSVLVLTLLDMCFAPQRHASSHLSSGQMVPYPLL